MSVWGEDIFTRDNALHASGGAILSAIIAEGFWHPWTLMITVPFVTFCWGYIREVAQSENDWLSPIHRPHKLWEAFSWAVGSQLAMTALFCVWRFA